MATAAEFKHGSRTTVTGSDCGLDVIELVGRTESSHARFPLGDHDHGQAYEICYLKRGSQTFTVGRDHFTIRGGEFFITYPHERHGTGHEPLGRSILYWVILNPSAVQTARVERVSGVAAVIADVLQEIEQAGIRSTRATGGIDELFDRIFDRWERESPVRDAEILNAVMSIVLELHRCGTEQPGAPVSREITAVSDRIEACPAERFTIAEMAAKAGLSESHFRARFEDELGMPPAEYATRVRIRLAKQALAAGSSVTDVAFDLGFASSQYFATVFKQFTGKRPSDFYYEPHTDTASSADQTR